MTPLRIAAVASIFTSATLSFAANLPHNANVVVCQPNAGCIHHTIFGHDYKLLSTDRFSVMVFLSNEGRYTRADVSITNLTATPINLTPEDFHIQALTSRSKSLLLRPTLATAEPPNANSRDPKPPRPDTPLANPNPNSENDELQAATPHLKAITIPPNQAVHGRVYFERESRATPQQVNVVLPIAGTVFKFPDVIKP